MTRLAGLHTLLVEAAREQEHREREHTGAERCVSGGNFWRRFAAGAWLWRSGSARGSRVSSAAAAALASPRVAVLAVLALLGSATIALAATGVLSIGSPVRPTKPPTPTAGIGAPIPSRVQMLSLRVPDPRGGLPWGVRVVPTTRGSLCLQVGRVQNGKLGELGIDGAFGEDGKFHPLSIDALPERGSYGGTASSAETQCILAGERFSYTMAIASSAAPIRPSAAKGFPRRELRSVSVGLLGRNAVSVTYRSGGGRASERVASRRGIYLIVKRADRRALPIGESGGVRGSGEFAPHKPLVAIAYRVDGKLCESTWAHVRDRCKLGGVPAPSVPRTPAAIQRRLRERTQHGLHGRLRPRLIVSAEHVVTAVAVSFRAPYTVGSARSTYTIGVRRCSKWEGLAVDSFGGATTESLERDVRAGGEVKMLLPYPFDEACPTRTRTIEVLYEHGGRPSFAGLFDAKSVGSVQIEQPRGTRGVAPWGRRTR